MSRHPLPLHLLKPGPPDAPLRIGLPVDTAAHGPELIVAAHLALEAHRQRGGPPVSAIWCDDHRNADGGRAAARTLIRSGTRYVVGHFSSRAALAALPIYADAEAILLAPGSSAPELTASAAPVIRLFGRDDAQAEAIADALLQSAPRQSVDILGEDNGYGRGVSRLLARALDRRGIAADVTMIDDGENGVRGGNGPVVLAGRHEFAARMLRHVGASRRRIATDDALTPAFLHAVGAAAEGVEIAGLGDDGSPRTQALQDAYGHLMGEPPGGYFLSSYVAIDLLLGALRACGDRGGAEISAHLRSRSWPTALGVLGFDARGDVQGLTWRMARVAHGRFA